jgi:hypothetical protein
MATLLLVHFDGVDAAQSAVDSSGNNVPITFVGTAALSETQAKFGDTSLLSDGGGVNFAYADLSTLFATLDLADGDFTFEYQYYGITTAGGDEVLAYGQADAAAGNDHIGMLHSNNSLFMEHSTDGTTEIQTDSALDVADGAWEHIAIVREGVLMTTYLDGVAGVGTVDMTGVTLHPLDAAAVVLFARTGNGYLDEVRISDTAVYTENFTPPTAAFTSGGGGATGRTLTRALTRGLTRGLTRTIGA